MTPCVERVAEEATLLLDDDVATSIASLRILPGGTRSKMAAGSRSQICSTPCRRERQFLLIKAMVLIAGLARSTAAYHSYVLPLYNKYGLFKRAATFGLHARNFDVSVWLWISVCFLLQPQSLL